MKIAMLGAKSVPAIGGIAHYIEEIGSRLAARGHEVTVYCRPHFLEGDADDYRGMERLVTRGLRGKHLDATTHTLTSAFHAMRSGYDIYHIHGAAPGMIAPLMRLRPRGYSVITLHGLDWTGSKWGPLAAKMMHTAARLGIGSADSVTAVSHWVKEECRGRLGCDATFIPTGVNFQDPVPARELATLGLAPKEYLFCASRLVKEKGVHYLVDAFRDLSTDKMLVIAGNCPYDDPYVRSLQDRAGDNVLFAGYVKGRLLAELYSNAYVYVQPSESEGLPISVLEALSYGTCVLASDIPQNLEALGRCGYTFASRDAAALCERLQYLLANPSLVASQFDRARAYIRRERNWDLTTDRFEELYSKLLLTGRRLRLISQNVWASALPPPAW